MRGLIPTAWWRSKARGPGISRARRGRNAAKRPRRNARKTSIWRLWRRSGNRRLWRRIGIAAAASVAVLGAAGLWYGGWVERGLAAAPIPVRRHRRRLDVLRALRRGRFAVVRPRRESEISEPRAFERHQAVGIRPRMRRPPPSRRTAR